MKQQRSINTESAEDMTGFASTSRVSVLSAYFQYLVQTGTPVTRMFPIELLRDKSLNNKPISFEKVSSFLEQQANSSGDHMSIKTELSNLTLILQIRFKTLKVQN